MPDLSHTADPAQLYYVLSAGRTGTLFLETLIRSYMPDIRVEHEPSPSRYLLMMGNMRNDTGLLPGLTHRFARWHQRNLHDGPETFIEINPFLCPVTDLLPHPDHALRIVHMVRSPSDWSRSMTTFKASTKFRRVIDYVPFAKPYPKPRPQGWSALSPFEKGLHRWNWCNTRIEALADKADAYVRIRMEDVFGPDATAREAALSQLCETLRLDLPEDLDPAIFSKRVNPSPVRGDLRDPEAVRRICGPLADRYGYAV